MISLCLYVFASKWDMLELTTLRYSGLISPFKNNIIIMKNYQKIYILYMTYLLAFSKSDELTMRRIIVSGSTKRYWFCKVSRKWNFCSSKCSFLLTRNSLSWHAKLSLRLIVTNSKQTVYILIYSRYFFQYLFFE